MTSLTQNSFRNYSKGQNDPEQIPQLRRLVMGNLAKVSRLLFVLVLLMTPISCGFDPGIENQAEAFIHSIQNLDIDKCVEMSNLYQIKLAGIQNEPQFKMDQMIAAITTEIRKTLLNQYDNDSIIYVFNFPCQWQILETKKLSQEICSGVLSTTNEYYRVFVSIKYNSMEKSPASIPLINKDYNSKYNIKEIILHCDFDPETRLYLGWGLDNHTRW